MPRPPNYQFERLERQRAKDAKSAAKAAAKRRPGEEPDPGGQTEKPDAG